MYFCTPFSEIGEKIYVIHSIKRIGTTRKGVKKIQKEI